MKSAYINVIRDNKWRTNAKAVQIINIITVEFTDILLHRINYIMDEVASHAVCDRLQVNTFT